MKSAGATRDPGMRGRHRALRRQAAPSRALPHSMEPAWARHLRDACLIAGVAFFWKQWGGATTQSAGYILDAREWSEQPRTLGEDGSWRDSAGEVICSRCAPSGEPNTSTIPAYPRLFSAESVGAAHGAARRTFRVR